MNIQFLNPAFLFALSAISIPIIVHLFNFRRFKKVYFTNVKFLRDVQQETRSRSKLKHLLILLSRILAVSFLVLAFAQPIIPFDKQNKAIAGHTISVYIDNSFSMEQTGPNGSLINDAMKKAVDIASAYEPATQFQLITNDFEARHQRLVPRDEFISLVEEVTVSPSSTKLSDVYARQRDAYIASGAGVFTAYMISDFQKSVSDVENIRIDTNAYIRLIPLPSNQISNIYIDSCWFSNPVVRPGQPQELVASIRNSSSTDQESVPIKLFINGIQKSLASVSVKAGSSEEATITFTVNDTGWHKAEVTITDHPVTFDDRYFFSFEVYANLKILALNQSSESSYLKALFQDDTFFSLSNTSVSQVNYTLLSSYNLIIINEADAISTGLGQELGKFIQSGGSVLLFPAVQPDFTSYREFLTSLEANYFTVLDTVNQRVASISHESKLLKDVFEKVPQNIDLPLVKKHFVFTKGSRTSEEPLMRLQNGASFISRYNVSNGSLYLSSVPLREDFSNFCKHAILVPVMYKIALNSVRKSSLTYTIGQDNTVEFLGMSLQGEQVMHLVNDETEFDLIPEHRTVGAVVNLFIHDQIKSAGNYELQSGGEVVAVYSFNYNRDESLLEALKTDELLELSQKTGSGQISLLNATAKEFSKAVSEANTGIILWKWCIILALLCIALEIALIKLWN